MFASYIRDFDGGDATCEQATTGSADWHASAYKAGRYVVLGRFSTLERAQEACERLFGAEGAP